MCVCVCVCVVTLTNQETYEHMCVRVCVTRTLAFRVWCRAHTHIVYIKHTYVACSKHSVTSVACSKHSVTPVARSKHSVQVYT